MSRRALPYIKETYKLDLDLEANGIYWYEI